MKQLSNSSQPLESTQLKKVGDRFYMPYVRNESGVRRFLTDQTRRAFQVDLEPWGTYLLPDPLVNAYGGGLHFERGVLAFSNPLFVDGDYWKDALSGRYDGLTGKTLSKAVECEGYDCIITHDSQGVFGEIVALEGTDRFQYARNQVFFHGTNQAFEQFDSSHLSSSTDHPSSRHGFFFSDDPDCASIYAEHASRRMVSDRIAYEKKCAALLANFERLQKIASRTGRSSDWGASDQAYIDYEEFELSGVNEEPNTGACVYPAFLDLGRILPVFVDKDETDFFKQGLEHYVNLAKSHGFDSVVYVNILDVPAQPDQLIRPSNHAVVFDTSRIRSVFDPQLPMMPRLFRHASTQVQPNSKTRATSPSF